MTEAQKPGSPVGLTIISEYGGPFDAEFAICTTEVLNKAMVTIQAELDRRDRVRLRDEAKPETDNEIE